MLQQNDIYISDNTNNRINFIKKIFTFILTFILLFSLFGFNSSITVAASIKAPTIQSATANSATSVTVKWKKVSGANGYTIYQKKANGEYKKIATLKSGLTVSYTKKGLASATKYSYKIKSYKTAKGKNTYSAFSKIKSTYTKPVAPKLSIKVLSSSSIKLSWNKIANADGYELFYKSGNTYKRFAKIKTNKITSYTATGLKDGKKYTFAIGSYFTPSASAVSSVKSATKSATTSVATVWIPTKGGTKYHANSGCSNMINPNKVTKAEAIELGFDACKRCYG